VIPLLLALLADGVDWRGDYEAARAEAREKNRRIVLHFYLPGRPICRAMDEETFAQAEVARAIREKFIGVRLDVEAKPELFESAIGSRGVLATCVMDADGDVISELRGYAGPQAFLKFLEKAESGYAAIRAARDALRNAPADVARLYALGEAYRLSDSPRRADECYRKAAAGPPAEPAVAQAHERLARLCVMRGRNLEARTHLEAARKLDPEAKSTAADRLLLTEGLILAVERRHPEAAALLRDGLKRTICSMRWASSFTRRARIPRRSRFWRRPRAATRRRPGCRRSASRSSTSKILNPTTPIEVMWGDESISFERAWGGDPREQHFPP
jgi:tetratricopeptide (TPR) repeat protein